MDRVSEMGFKPMTSDSEEQCVFCKRIKNEEYDDRFANHVMFEPLNPVTDGHRLVVPVPHTPHLNTGELEAGQTGWALRYFTNDLDQYNIITSKGSDATQTIQHLHFHIVPRTKDDGLKLPWSGQHTDDHANTEPLRELAQEAQSEAPSVETIIDELLNASNELNHEVRHRNDDLHLLPGDVKIAREKYIAEATAKINRLIEQAKQEPVGAALEIKVAPETMQAVMARIKMTDKNIADRVLEPLWRIEVWRKGTGDTYDYEVELWKLRILAHLTRRFNWAAFLLKPDNLDGLRTRAALSNNLSKGDGDG